MSKYSTGKCKKYNVYCIYEPFHEKYVLRSGNKTVRRAYTEFREEFSGSGRDVSYRGFVSYVNELIDLGQ